MGWRAAVATVMGLVLYACGSDRTDAAAPDASVDASPTADAATSDASDVRDGSAPDGGACEALPTAQTFATTGASPTSKLALTETSPGALGTYDPSLVYPTGAPGGVMSYSYVALDDVHTRIAVSTDHGASFTLVAEPNTSTSMTFQTTDMTACNASACAGKLWHEVSSIVADPQDPSPSRAFKLFVHSYASLGNGQNLRRDWGYIGLYTAAAPEGPWSSEAPLLGWTSSSPISSTGVSQKLTDLPGLADCIAFTEPGAALTSSGLDLALTCLTFQNGTLGSRIMLFRSADHAASFQYVSTLLDSSDRACLGSASILNGPDLFTTGGKTYLLVSPSRADGTYGGCYTIPFDDVGAGKLLRGPGGGPKVVRALLPSDGSFAGPCTFAEAATQSGYLLPMIKAFGTAATHFDIYPTGVTTP